MVNVDTMLFCSGHAFMADGKLMVSGGHKLDDKGIDVTNIFDPGTQSFASGLPKMAFGRWYPTVTEMPDGRMLTMAGRDSAGNVVTTPEIWENNQWVTLPGAGTLQIPYYPRNFVDPAAGSHRIFMAGERIVSRWFDPDGSTASGRGQWTTGPAHIYNKNRDYGTAVMYEAGKILYAGGGGDTGWPHARRQGGGAHRDRGADRPHGRHAAHGPAPARCRCPGATSTRPCCLTGRCSSPAARAAAASWTSTRATPRRARSSGIRRTRPVDHPRRQQRRCGCTTRCRCSCPTAPCSTAPAGTRWPARSVVPDETNHEIFSPPYLFKGARPTITTVPSSVSYTQTFSVATPNAAQITDVRWIRIGSVTHAFDAGQRANTLSFARTATGVDVTAPATANLAPPGHYILFILNRNGVPSVGKIVHIQ